MMLERASTTQQRVQQALSRELLGTDILRLDPARADTIESRRPQDELTEPISLPIQALYVYAALPLAERSSPGPAARSQVTRQPDAGHAATSPSAMNRGAPAFSSVWENKMNGAPAALDRPVTNTKSESANLAAFDSADKRLQVESDTKEVTVAATLPVVSPDGSSKLDVPPDCAAPPNPIPAGAAGRHTLFSLPVVVEAGTGSSRIEMTYRLASWAPEASVALTFDYAEPDAAVKATASDDRVREVLEDALPAADAGGAELPLILLTDGVLDDPRPPYQNDDRHRRPQWVPPDDKEE